MGNDERSKNTNIPAEQPRGRTSLDEYGRGAESDCARAMAEIERVLHELALTRGSSPERLSPANEASNAPSLVPAPSPIDRLVLDAGLDFIFHKDGMIELTEAGFRRMGQAHSAGLDTVIEVEGALLIAPRRPEVEVCMMRSRELMLNILTSEQRRMFLQAVSAKS